MRIFFGGNRSGKTTAGANEVRWLAEGTHPFREYRVPVKICIVCQDFTTHADKVINPKIEEWFPPGLIVKRNTNQVNVINRYTCRTGSTIDIMSHDQAIKVFEGSDYDVVWFDEPPPQAIFKALWRGLTDRRGICFITGTPITEPWLHDLYTKAQKEKNKGLYWSIFAEIHDNVKNIGEGDVKEGKERIKEFLDAIDDPDEREAREKGRFLHMRGLIFKKFDPEIHLIKPFPWPNEWPVYFSLDPHPRKPWGFSAIGVSKHGYKFLLHSEVIEGVVQDVAERVLQLRHEIETRKPGLIRVHSCWIDNYASVESMVKRNVTITEELNSYTYPTIPRFKPAPKNVSEKIDLFKAWLKVRDTNYGPQPGFMAFDSDVNTYSKDEKSNFLYEITHYVWQTFRGADRNKLKDIPKKENDDILDTILQLALVLDGKRGKDAKQDQPRVHNYARGLSGSR